MLKKQVKSGIIYTENSGGLTVAVLSVQYRNSADFAERNAFMYKIVTKKSLNPTVTLMEIEAPLVAAKAKPGQFIILRVDEDGERIPLTVAGYDRARGTIKIIFQIVGATTAKLNHKNEGEYIQDFVGPLGVPTKVDGLKKVCIVGGGVGCAIALPIAEERRTVRHGANGRVFTARPCGSDHGVRLCGRPVRECVPAGNGFCPPPPGPVPLRGDSAKSGGYWSRSC